MLPIMVFLGREGELAQLAEALQRTADGGSARMVLAGPAGIGISCLLDELSRRLAGLPHVVIGRGHGVEPRALVPYGVLTQALDGALAALDDDSFTTAVGPAGHDLVLLEPDTRDRLDRLGVSHDAPALEAHGRTGDRIVESVIGMFGRIAEDRVLLLALEDLHWADPATRRAVETLLRSGRSRGICILLSCQPDELHRRHPARRFISGLLAAPDIALVDLPPFTDEGLTLLAERLSGERPSAHFVAALREGSGGNPLLASQLVAVHSALKGIRMSDPFEEVLGARLETLAAPARRLVRVLAAARRPLPRSTCLALPALHEQRLTQAAVEEALASGLVVDPAAGAELCIFHELGAEAIESISLPPERRANHATLAGHAGLRPAEAAWHWAASARPADARAAYLQAASEAGAVDPGESALLHFQAALDLGDAPEGDADPAAALATTLGEAARAAAFAGSFRRAASLVQRAIDTRPRRITAGDGQRVGRSEEERLRLGELYEGLGRYRWAGGDLVGGLEAMDQALAVIPDRPTRPRASALAATAQHLMIDGRFAESARMARQAQETARRAEPVALEELGHATCTLGVDAAYTGDLDGGLALLEEATEMARKSGHLDDLMRAYANRTTLLDLDSRREQALTVVKEGIRDARAAGLGDTYGAFLRGNAADILFQLGRWSESEVECRAGMAYRPASVAWFSPILYLGLVLVESRADEEAASLVGQTLLQLEHVPAGQWTALVLRAAVSLLLWRDEAADAVAVAEREWPRVLETSDALQIAAAASTALEAAAALAEQGRQKRDYGSVGTAGELAARALGDAERQVGASTLGPTLGARREADLHLATARAHLTRLRGKPSVIRWTKVAEGWSSVGNPYQQAKARWWQASAELQAGQGREAAHAPLLESWRISGQLGALPLRRDLADLARRARLRLPDVRPEDLATPAAPPLMTGSLVAVPVVGSPATASTDRSAGAGFGELRTLVPVGPGRVGPDIPDTSRAIEERLAYVPPWGTGDRFGLSPREAEVLVVLTRGRTNREIAERLFISERTVAVHVRRILAKMKVSGRVEAAGLAIRLGLVPDEGAPARRGTG